MQDVVDRAYHDIANAIIVQAVEDYRNALKGISYEPNVPAEFICQRLERFFRSQWYRTLTNVSGEYLIEQINKEHLENAGGNDEGNIDTSNT